MQKAKPHHESHRYESVAWLRAAVLGANDGIVSTSSLIVGVAAAHASHQNILISGAAGLIAGAIAMAAGEYVSVSSQADIEKADLARERHELKVNAQHEQEELAQIYVERGLEPALARQVADQLMRHDALGSHARDELGITAFHAARPVQAAIASALSFSIGAALPLLTTLFAPQNYIFEVVALSSVGVLLLLGALAAKVGGANPWKGALRVGFWGFLGLALTAAAGTLFGAAL